MSALDRLCLHYSIELQRRVLIHIQAQREIRLKYQEQLMYWQEY